MPTKCFAFGCKSILRKNHIKFYRLPTGKHRLKKWLQILKIGGTLNHRTAKICSLHFSRNQFLNSVSYILRPRAVPDQNIYEFSQKSEVPLEVMECISDSVVNIDMDNHSPTKKGNRFDQPFRTYLPSSRKRIVQSSEQVLEYVPSCSDNFGSDVASYVELETAEEKELSFEGVSNAVDGSDSSSCNENINQSQIKAVTTSAGILSVETLYDEQMKYLTGHSKVEFNFILQYMTANQPDSKWPTEKLRLSEQLLLTLIKYRLNLDYLLLSIMFKIGCRTVSKIFSYWTNLMYDKLSIIDFWSLRAKSESLYTVILDCTEIPIEKPISAEEQQITWSSYKNCNTFKGLIGIDEAGTVIFVSKLFGGAATDNTIVKNSGILELLSAGDFILADRGFEATDALSEKGIILNKPPKKKGLQMSETEVATTRLVASRRINVERIIGHAKNSRILSQKVDHSMFKHMDTIFYVIFALVNIKASICKPVKVDCWCK
ncbi:uncharacterized protein LOC110678674 isoform X2 [Aedes aegypti]|uniref:Uncharacterized protein n=1 Tax=Aedes aegypti TaxID=7159 RepID=A0A6I8U655_AEDAE|nr:uncharacterized protein LOC110678674 isoform X2 [Aedes aegypti]